MSGSGIPSSHKKNWHERYSFLKGALPPLRSRNPPKGATCPAIDRIIKEADETAGEIEDKAVLDAAIVALSPTVRLSRITRSLAMAR